MSIRVLTCALSSVSIRVLSSVLTCVLTKRDHRRNDGPRDNCRRVGIRVASAKLLCRQYVHQSLNGMAHTRVNFQQLLICRPDLQ